MKFWSCFYRVKKERKKEICLSKQKQSIETKNLIRLLGNETWTHNWTIILILEKKERQFAGIRARETRLIAKLYSSLDV